MTDPISSFRRVAQMDSSNRQAAAKAQERSSDAASETLLKAAPTQSDEVKLSEVAQKAMQEPEFDRAKVEAIKLAIQQGQYPMDTRRIAENFMAIEKMIQD
ncbi:flagellar biosynthesis anti-sigma factor FlgM [uncultured Limnohabitans sp.]|jgi:negative regulator of flagellin synthesis FlgM|uniref:flagellar biosynthesis anti-sigma factor FlgM n=1 Tax=uncultured Limnohabitans sp. TaxID=768543 RepID=UPI002634E58D|nr:flagellar biosynthesis anti-sigma factor FlgM [uncultured Limnohabitans sp.]